MESGDRLIIGNNQRRVSVRIIGYFGLWIIRSLLRHINHKDWVLLLVMRSGSYNIRQKCKSTRGERGAIFRFPALFLRNSRDSRIRDHDRVRKIERNKRNPSQRGRKWFRRGKKGEIPLESSFKSRVLFDSYGPINNESDNKIFAFFQL